MRSQTELIGYFRPLSEIVVTDPNRVQIVVNSLVVHEWNQNKDEVEQEMKKWIIATDNRIQEIHKTHEQIGSPLQTQAPTYDDPLLIDAFTSRSESLLGSSLVLEEDNACLISAIQRVKDKKRPSHKKEIKDSIHLEHYLELSSRLRVLGYSQPSLFVSTNKSDFWKNENNPRSPHLDLEAELGAAQLKFYGSMAFALRHLGIIPGAPPS